MRKPSGKGRAHRRRSCESKHRYATETEAVAAAIALRKRTDWRGRAVHCPYCGQYHLARADKRTRQAAAARHAHQQWQTTLGG